MMKKLSCFMIGVFAVVASAPASPTWAANNVEIGDKTITITVLIELIGGNQELANRWGPAIRRTWNAGPNGQPFRYCGREVLITTDIKVIPPGGHPTRGDYHVVWARPYGPDRRFIASVGWGGSHNSYRPGEYNYSGEWEHHLNPSPEDLAWEEWLAAHEFGHMLGLWDEFTWEDLNKNGQRDPNEPTKPDLAKYPDADRSIMGKPQGRVLQRHINEVARRHDLHLFCKLHVYYELVYRLRTTTDYNEHTVELTMKLDEDVGGVLIGSGTGKSRFVRRLDNPPSRCESRGSNDHAFDVDGRKTGDNFRIELPKLETPLKHSGGRCVGADSILDVHKPVIEGQLIDGVFEKTEQVYHGKIHTRVEEKFEKSQ